LSEYFFSSASIQPQAETLVTAYTRLPDPLRHIAAGGIERGKERGSVAAENIPIKDVFAAGVKKFQPP
jgi:hypothetical protein